jgi:hypothetical protein
MATAILNLPAKSSYAYLNNKALTVVEVVGRRVTVLLTAKEMGEDRAAGYHNGEAQVDFTLSEVAQLYTDDQQVPARAATSTDQPAAKTGRVAKTAKEMLEGDIMAGFAAKFNKSVSSDELLNLELTHDKTGGNVTYGRQIYTFSLTPKGRLKTTKGVSLRYYGSVSDAANGIAGVGA